MRDSRIRSNKGFFARFFSINANKEDVSVKKTSRTRHIFRDSEDAFLVAESGKTHISFDSDLIGFLQDDHKNLFGIFQSIETSARSGDYQKSTNEIGVFLKLLRDHVFEENFKLYGYLKSCDPLDINGVIEMQAEMRSIQIIVRKELEGYQRVGIDSGNVKKFLMLLVGKTGNDPESVASRNNSLKTALAERIQTEESRLYPVYKSLGNINGVSNTSEYMR